MLPNFLVVGAPRAGSTWIHENLKMHPEIFLPTHKKEIHFFDWHYNEGLVFYEEIFKHSHQYKAVGEVTPSYLHKTEVAERIKKHLPDVKLIVCLRNPVDRLYSRYWNSKAKYESNKDKSFEDKIKEKHEFIEEGFYDEHLVRYFSLFDPKKILVLFFEEMSRDPQGFLKKIFSFLDVNATFVPEGIDRKINASAGKRKLAKNRYLYYLHKALGKAGFKTLAYKIAEKNKIKLPEMNSKTRAWLINDIYAEHNKNLATLLNVDLSHWNKL